MILWHSEPITQLVYTLQSPRNRQSCLIMQHDTAAVLPIERDGRRVVWAGKRTEVYGTLALIAMICSIFWLYHAASLSGAGFMSLVKITFLATVEKIFVIPDLELIVYLCSKILSKCRCLLSSFSSGRTPQQQRSMITGSGLSLILQTTLSLIWPCFVG